MLVARRLRGSSVEVIYFSGSTARWLVSRDYQATEPPQRIYIYIKLALYSIVNLELFISVIKREVD